MVSISVVIITFNEERNLALCLTSVAGVADEIIVADSYSTDNTISIAESFNARVIQREFTGYSDQKNFATSQAVNDWILSLDADEVLSAELRDSILKIKANPALPAYRMARLTNYCGKWIKHCGWYPDRQLRLYNRTKGRWQEKKVHEYWALNDKDGQIGELKGDIMHYSFNSVEEHIKKIEKYTDLAAQAAADEGRDPGMGRVIMSPVWHFFSEYFLKLGFLDGFYGYTICRLSAYSAYKKYSKMRMYNRAKR